MPCYDSPRQVSYVHPHIYVYDVKPLPQRGQQGEIKVEGPTASDYRKRGISIEETQLYTPPLLHDATTHNFTTSCCATQPSARSNAICELPGWSAIADVGHARLRRVQQLFDSTE